MINLSPTFLSEYHNVSRGLPGNIDPNLRVPTLVKAGKKITTVYGDKSHLKNPVFPRRTLRISQRKKHEIIN